jgi:hypothetical protein
VVWTLLHVFFLPLMETTCFRANFSHGTAGSLPYMRVFYVMNVIIQAHIRAFSSLSYDDIILTTPFKDIGIGLKTLRILISTIA